MPIIYSAATDGGARSYGPTSTSWDSVHDNNGDSHSFAVPTAANNNLYGPGVFFDGTDYTVYRTFFAFDVSGISSAPGSAIFKFKSDVYANGDIIAVKATKPDTSSNLANADIGALTGYTSGFNNSNLTAYSAEITGGGTVTAWHTITLNAAALSDMGSEDTVLKICLMNYDHDYLDSAPTSTSTTAQRFGVYWADSTGTSNDPYIEYVLGYSHEVSGIATGDISEVSGVATANIASRSGVDT